MSFPDALSSRQSASWHNDDELTSLTAAKWLLGASDNLLRHSLVDRNLTHFTRFQSSIVSPFLTFLMFALPLLALLLAASGAHALHSGAPSLACTSLRPFHGLNVAKPASSSQFFLSQSALNYAPNGTIAVNITTHSTDRHFRGFLVQAYEPSSDNRIGSFQPNEQSRPLDCSAATHRDATDKQHISLTWLPPSEKEKDKLQQSRQVRFRATIVASYQEFYTGFESSHLSYDKLSFAI